MRKVGLTGGIGSGKSTICKIFSLLGASVYEADKEARLLLDEKEIKNKIITVLGKDVLDESGNIDRRKTAAKVFSDKQSLEKLNSIVHPAVKNHFEQWLKKQNAKYIIKEAAILFESGANEGLDEVIAISSPEHLRIKRVMQRDGISEEQVRARMRNQWSDEEKIKKAQHVIVNDEVQLILPQILKIHKHLST